MAHTEKNESSHESIGLTWLWIGILLAWILGKWLLSFTMVGNPGPPTWDYRPIRDVPGQSPYAVYQLVPNPQHVRGAGGQ